jgi:hypothetical protein
LSEDKESIFMVRAAIFLSILWLVVACSSNPFLEQTLKPAAERHESKEWFEKEWGKPSGTSSRFWGGERWTYYRIVGGSERVLGGLNPYECEIELNFDKEGKLQSYSTSGC